MCTHCVCVWFDMSRRFLILYGGENLFLKSNLMYKTFVTVFSVHICFYVFYIVYLMYIAHQIEIRKKSLRR